MMVVCSRFVTNSDVTVCVQVISAALSLLTPDRANLLLLSPENEGRCSLREKWFGTCYSMEGETDRHTQTDRQADTHRQTHTDL